MNIVIHASLIHITIYSCTHNEYMLSYLLAQASLRRKRNLAITPGEEGAESKVPNLTSDGEMEEDDDDDLENMFPGEELEPWLWEHVGDL